MAYCKGLTKQHKKIKDFLINNIGVNLYKKPKDIKDFEDFKCETYSIIKKQKKWK